MFKSFKILRRAAGSLILMAAASASTRLGNIEGFAGRRNEIIYHPSKEDEPVGNVIFFGGDCQDYKENMLQHRDNRHHVEFDLEATAVLLHERFPQWSIFVVKPRKMTLMSFSCFENFVEVNNFGVPTHRVTDESLRHLRSLLQGVDHETKSSNATRPLVLIGFSKGCVVLNQLLHAFLAVRSSVDEELDAFIKQVEAMYWLDGGHSGGDNTWVTDKDVLQHFSTLDIRVRIHVTPYQMFCESRPRIGKEEKMFRETLRKAGVRVERFLHFGEEPRSLNMHFRVLEVFEKLK